MSYYGAGDYYGAGGLGGILKGIGKVAIGTITGGPLGGLGALGGILTGGSGGPVPPTGGLPPIALPFAGGGKGPTTTVTMGPSGEVLGVRKKRRRMNYANSKALTRANRRVDGFVRLAKRSLKHTNYKIVSKQSGRSRRPVSIRESGPGSVRVG